MADTATNARLSSGCPMPGIRDDRKSARMAAERVAPDPGTQVTGSFLFARDILRSGTMWQGGVGLRLERGPTLLWCDALTSYELRDAIVACDRVR